MGVVYLAVCDNGMCYVGKTVGTLESRKRQHKKRADRDSCLPFHRAIRKYGMSAFQWDVLLESCDDAVLIIKEIEAIAEYETKIEYGGGYNVTDGGEGVVGAVRTEEWKNKQSKMIKEKWQDPDFRSRVIAGMAAANTPERAKKISDAKQRSGHRHSEKTRALISKKAKIQWQSKEGRQRVLSAMQSTDARRKLSEKMKGNKNSRVGESNNKAVLTESDVIDIRILIASGFAITIIARWYKVSKNCIRRIRDDITWKHVGHYRAEKEMADAATV